MATVVYDPLKDWFEIFTLAGGEHFESVLSGLNLVNNSVTQIALDQAILDNIALIQSPNKIAEIKETNEVPANPSTIALALLGDDASMTALQSMVGLTEGAVVLPVGGIGKIKSSYFIGTMPLLSPIPTIATTIPFVTSLFKGITNLAGVLTIALPGIYQLQFTAPIEFSVRRLVFVPTLFVNAVADPITGTLVSAKDNLGIRWPSMHSFNKTISITAPNTTVSISVITDDLAATYSVDFSIVRIG